MASGWRKRLRRGRLGWLGRIDGVEKPAILLGLGLVLYRVWRTADPAHPNKGRLRSLFGRLRDHLTRGFKSVEEKAAPEAPAPAPVANSAPPLPPSPRP
jgi:hypothetical protein